MGREVTNLSIKEARAQLAETLTPETDWPEPTDVNDQMEAAEKDAIAAFEEMERTDRANMTGF